VLSTITKPTEIQWDFTLVKYNLANSKEHGWPVLNITSAFATRTAESHEIFQILHLT
jgi:hypothetical protein